MRNKDWWNIDDLSKPRFLGTKRSPTPHTEAGEAAAGLEVADQLRSLELGAEEVRSRYGHENINLVLPPTPWSGTSGSSVGYTFITLTLTDLKYQHQCCNSIWLCHYSWSHLNLLAASLSLLTTLLTGNLNCQSKYIETKMNLGDTIPEPSRAWRHGSWYAWRWRRQQTSPAPPWGPPWSCRSLRRSQRHGPCARQLPSIWGIREAKGMNHQPSAHCFLWFSRKAARCCSKKTLSSSRCLEWRT